MRALNKTFIAVWFTYALIMGVLVGTAAHAGYKTYQNFQKVTLQIVTNENP